MKLELIFKEFPVFNKWAVEKKLNATHLSILTEFNQLETIKNLIHWIETHLVSHSEGVQILDLAGELLLMDKNITPLLKQHQTTTPLIKELKKLRFPNSSLSEEKKRELLNKMDLGSSIQAKWMRQKDRTGLQLQFTSFSPRDFKQKIEKLKSLYNENKLWDS